MFANTLVVTGKGVKVGSSTILVSDDFRHRVLNRCARLELESFLFVSAQRQLHLQRKLLWHDAPSRQNQAVTEPTQGKIWPA